MLKQDRPQSVSPEECTFKNMPTHKLKQDRPHLCDEKNTDENQANSQTDTKQAPNLCHQMSAH